MDESYTDDYGSEGLIDGSPCPDRCMRCDDLFFGNCYEFFVDTAFITVNLIVCADCFEALVEENPNGDYSDGEHTHL